MHHRKILIEFASMTFSILQCSPDSDGHQQPLVINVWSKFAMYYIDIPHAASFSKLPVPSSSSHIFCLFSTVQSRLPRRDFWHFVQNEKCDANIAPATFNFHMYTQSTKWWVFQRPDGNFRKCVQNKQTKKSDINTKLVTFKVPSGHSIIW